MSLERQFGQNICLKWKKVESGGIGLSRDGSLPGKKITFHDLFFFLTLKLFQWCVFQHLPTGEGFVSLHLCFYPTELALRYSLCFHELAITLFFFFFFSSSVGRSGFIVSSSLYGSV